jgi:hypothetical protein
MINLNDKTSVVRYRVRESVSDSVNGNTKSKHK